MSRGIKKQNQSHEDDRRLAQSFKEGNSAAFDKLVFKYQDMIFNLCYRIIGDYDEANDCAQETFIKIYRNLNKFKFRSGFSTWAYRIAVNTCKNHLSSSVFRFTRKMVRLDSPGNPGDSPDKIDVRNGKSNPEKLFDRKEKAQDIQRAIDALPGLQKIVVVLRDIEGKSYEEIAGVTGMKIGTVKSKLSRARQHLRDDLRGIIK